MPATPQKSTCLILIFQRLSARSEAPFGQECVLRPRNRPGFDGPSVRRRWVVPVADQDRDDVGRHESGHDLDGDEPTVIDEQQEGNVHQREGHPGPERDCLDRGLDVHCGARDVGGSWK